MPAGDDMTDMARPGVRGRLRDARRGLVVAGLLGLLLAAIALALADPFAGSHGGGTFDNGSPTGLATVQRRSLTAQQTLVGTVGYAGTWSVAVPAGTSAGDLQQAEQQLASAHAASVMATSALAADATALATAAAAARAARLKEASDCAGANAAVPAAAVSVAATSSPCQSSMQTAETNQATFDAAHENVVADRAQLASAQTTLDSARRSLDAAQSASTAYGGSASFTSLPSVGAVVFRGQALYAINGQDTILLYGGTPAWRSLTAGMTPGRDVAELNANLRALGYGAITGDQFTAATRRGVESIQQAHGLQATGSLALGSVVFEPGAARVTGTEPAIGQSVQPGPIMTLSSTTHSVSIQLNAAEQSQVKVGNRVLITLPDNNTTSGVVDFVGKVATTSGGQNGGSAANTPALPVIVRFLHPADAGTLDQAPVNVLVTTASVRNALVVPVSALVALAGGGYALEIASSGAHQLVAVTPGLFDDADGLVQIKGSGVHAGQRVVVPASS